MATFSDSFLETGGDVMLKNHTPVGAGTGWTYVGTNDDAYSVDGANDALQPGLGGLGTTGVGYDAIAPDIGSADHQMWSQLLYVGTVHGNRYIAVRLVDENNFFGWRIAGSGATGCEFCKMVTGSKTSLSTEQGYANMWLRVTCEGNTVKGYSTGSTTTEPSSPGEDTNWGTAVATDTSGSHNTETSIGVVNASGASATDIWDNFRADPYPLSGGGTNPKNVFGGIMLDGPFRRAVF